MIIPFSLLPPSVFPTELQPLIYFTLMPVALIFGAVFLLLFWFLFMPPEAKLYIKNKFSKKDMFDVETESGVRILDTGTIYPGGLAILDKTKLKLLIGRPIPTDQIKMSLPDNVSNKGLKKIIKAIRNTEKTTLKGSIVKGLGCKIHRVYQSSAIVTSLATLVGLEYDGNGKSTQMAIPVLAKTKKQIEPTNLFIKKGMELKEWIVDVALPVEPSVIRAWSHLQVSPQQTDKLYYLGERLADLKQGSVLKKWLVPIILIVVVIAIVLIAVVLLSSGGAPIQPPPPTIL